MQTVKSNCWTVRSCNPFQLLNKLVNSEHHAQINSVYNYKCNNPKDSLRGTRYMDGKDFIDGSDHQNYHVHVQPDTGILQSFVGISSLKQFQGTHIPVIRTTKYFNCIYSIFFAKILRKLTSCVALSNFSVVQNWSPTKMFCKRTKIIATQTTTKKIKCPICFCYWLDISVLLICIKFRQTLIFFIHKAFSFEACLMWIRDWMVTRTT